MKIVRAHIGRIMSENSEKDVYMSSEIVEDDKSEPIAEARFVTDIKCGLRKRTSKTESQKGK